MLTSADATCQQLLMTFVKAPGYTEYEDLHGAFMGGIVRWLHEQSNTSRREQRANFCGIP